MDIYTRLAISLREVGDICTYMYILTVHISVYAEFEFTCLSGRGYLTYLALYLYKKFGHVMSTELPR